MGTAHMWYTSTTPKHEEGEERRKDKQAGSSLTKETKARTKEASGDSHQFHPLFHAMQE